MKPLVIYHDHCTDGFGAAFAAWLKLGDEADYLPMNYGQDPKSLIDMATLPDRTVYVLDFSFPREDMDGLFSLAKHVVWLDHHKTAFEMWCGKYEKGIHYTTEDVTTSYGDRVLIRLNDNKSGAMLAWEYFHPDTKVPPLIQHIDDRDRWVWKLDGSAELHAYLGSLQPWTFEQWRVLWRDSTSMQGGSTTILNAFKAEGAAILRAQKQHVERIAKGAAKCSVRGNFPDMGFRIFDGLAVNTPIFQSEVGHELAETSGTFGLSWYVADNGRVRCSFRSVGEYDVSSIARAFNGGGHRNAAGCEVEIETLLGWLKCREESATS